ncbi:hypothetical protein, partial [Aquiflexum lacus]|uniref:hypothetical protein n=1 Tax=Aquiflexum lacus TaxID=2483805 RepID=UPI001E4C59BE
MPGVPQLVAPANGAASVIVPEVQFLWLASEFVLGYQLQLATDHGFSQIVLDTETSDISFGTDVLLADTDYFWRVRSLNTGGSSD